MSNQPESTFRPLLCEEWHNAQKETTQRSLPSTDPITSSLMLQPHDLSEENLLGQGRLLRLSSNSWMNLPWSNAGQAAGGTVATSPLRIPLEKSRLERRQHLLHLNLTLLRYTCCSLKTSQVTQISGRYIGQVHVLSCRCLRPHCCSSMFQPLFAVNNPGPHHLRLTSVDATDD